MKAMVLEGQYDLNTDSKPLSYTEVSQPDISDIEILVNVKACGVCHTELDEIEGRTPPPEYPIIPGHEVVGIVKACGEKVERYEEGDRVGIAWIYSSCGECHYCRSGNENLCPDFRATGRDANGGYAEYMKIEEDFAYPIPEYFSDVEAAPFLCAGAIGYRSLKLTNIEDGMKLGLTGFGASGHLVLKLSQYLYPNTEIFVFARSKKQREFARNLGAVWAGKTEDSAPAKLNSIIDTTPAWKPVVEAMGNLSPGGRLVINAIRKEEKDKNYLLNLNYNEDLWMEKEIKSVANVARSDPEKFLKLASEIKMKPEIKTYKLQEANEALIDLKSGDTKGAKVLTI